MKIKITETQLSKLMSNKNLMLEQYKIPPKEEGDLSDDFWYPFYWKDEQGHVRDIRDAVNIGLEKLHKNVGRPVGKAMDAAFTSIWEGDPNIEWDGLKNGRAFGEQLPFTNNPAWKNIDNRKYILNDITNQMNEIPEIPASFKKLGEYLITGENYAEAIKTLKDKFSYVTNTENLKKELDDLTKGFKQYITYLKDDIATPIYDFFVECMKDWHCILDLASIAVLAIPGIGLALSAAIDIGNSAWYAVEYANAETPEEKKAALIAGGLTLFGGLMGGGLSQTRRLIKEANVNKQIYNYAADVMDLAKDGKTYTKTQQKLEYDKIYDKYKLTDSELKTATEIINEIKTYDVTLINQYTDALNAMGKDLNLSQRAELKNLMQRDDFVELLGKNNNDYVKTVKDYISKQAKKEAIVEGSLFFVLGKALEVPEVQYWVKDMSTYFTHKNRTDIRGRVEKEGYDWEVTKKLFGAISTKDDEGNPNKDFTNQKSLADNTKLTKAWDSGWRPYKRRIRDPKPEDLQHGFDWLLDPNHEKYRTETFIEKHLPTLKVDTDDKDPETKKELEQKRQKFINRNENEKKNAQESLREELENIINYGTKKDKYEKN